VTGGVQSWVVQGVAMRNVAIPDDNFVKFVAVAVETMALTPTIEPPAPPSNVSIGAIAVTVAGAAVAGGIVWHLMSSSAKKSRRR
jgi:hypothetical protein